MEDLIDFLNEKPDYNDKDFQLPLSDEDLQRIYRFCCSKGEKFFRSLLEYCAEHQVKTKKYKENPDWETLSQQLLKEIVFGLKEKVFVVNTHKICPLTMDAVTLMNLTVLLGNNFNSPRLSTPNIKKATVLVLLAHEICNISRIYLLGDGDPNIKSTSEKFKISAELKSRKGLESEREIGYHFEEVYLFQNAIDINPYHLPDELIIVLLDEQKWPLLDQTLADAFPNNNTVDGLSRTKRNRNIRRKHATFYLMQNLFQKCDTNFMQE